MSDLISREALKKTLNEIFDTVEVVTFDDIIATIDNAPTVEPDITDDDLQMAMTESYHLGYRLAETKFKRPKGELNLEYLAKFADKTPSYETVKQLGFAGSYEDYLKTICGAYMRGEEE